MSSIRTQYAFLNTSKVVCVVVVLWLTCLFLSLKYGNPFPEGKLSLTAAWSISKSNGLRGTSNSSWGAFNLQEMVPVSVKPDHLVPEDNNILPRNEYSQSNPPEKGVPHVSDCNLCFKCHGEKPHAPSSQIDYKLQSQLDRVMPREAFPCPSEDTVSCVYPLSPRKVPLNCTECYGCDHQLTSLESHAKTIDLKAPVFRGGTQQWVFIADNGPMAERSRDGKAIVKVWCIPAWKKLQASHQPCAPGKATKSAKILTAVDRVVVECGFESIVTRTWVGPVNGVVKGTGIVIDWNGVWSEVAPGISLASFYGSHAMRHRDLLKSVNSTEVVMAALFDLLTGQCDRHAENVFIDENSKLSLIDNEICLGEGRKGCGANSLFLPTTQKYAINQVGNVFLERGESPRKAPALDTMLDYRCHVHGGKLGSSYPPKIHQCMEKFSSMSAEALVKEFKFPLLKHAQVLKGRATAMLELGFERALEASNHPKHRYQWYSQCCTFTADFKCQDKWSMPTKINPGSTTTFDEHSTT